MAEEGIETGRGVAGSGVVGKTGKYLRLGDDWVRHGAWEGLKALAGGSETGLEKVNHGVKRDKGIDKATRGTKKSVKVI